MWNLISASGWQLACLGRLIRMLDNRTERDGQLKFWVAQLDEFTPLSSLHNLCPSVSPILLVISRPGSRPVPLDSSHA